MRRRTVVTGIGCVTPLGTSAIELWANLLAAKSGVGQTTLFDASNFPTKIAAEVRNWSIADVGEDASQWKGRSRHSCFAAGAATQAMADSGVLGTVEPRALWRLPGSRGRPAGLLAFFGDDGRRVELSWRI